MVYRVGLGDRYSLGADPFNDAQRKGHRDSKPSLEHCCFWLTTAVENGTMKKDLCKMASGALTKLSADFSREPNNSLSDSTSKGCCRLVVA